jgi:alpha-ketoglutarate-dependent taurine dioxygenase
MDMTSVAADVQLAITSLTGTTGAEIRRVNLRKRLDQATVDELRRVLAAYLFRSAATRCPTSGLSF